MRKFETNRKEYNGEKWSPQIYRSWDLNNSEESTKRRLLKIIKEAQKKVQDLSKHPKLSLTRAERRKLDHIATIEFPGLRT
jgi:hypothetical protein